MAYGLRSVYVSYSGRLSKYQHKTVFKGKKAAMVGAAKEIQEIQKLGFRAKVWQPLPVHKTSGHVHIVALITRSQLRGHFRYDYELQGR